MVVLLVVMPLAGGLTAAAYVACLAGCMGVTAITSGMTLSPACIGLCGCFDVETTVQTKNGLRLLSTIVPGQEVMTFDDDGKQVYTKVVANPFLPGNFSFNTFVFADYHRHVTLTDKHPLCVAGSGKCKPKEGIDIVVGDHISAPTRSGFAEVAGIYNRRGLGKYILQTDACTVVANGIRVATACNDVEKWADHTPDRSKEEILSWLASKDQNYDGVIQASEIITEFDKYLVFLDSDGNGRVTSQDLLNHSSFSIGDNDNDGDVDSDDVKAAYISYMDIDADGDIDKDDMNVLKEKVLYDLTAMKKAHAMANGKTEL